MYSFVSCVGFCSFCPRSSLQSSVRDGSLAPECCWPEQTGYRTRSGGGIHPARLAFVIYGVWVMSVNKDFKSGFFRTHPQCIDRSYHWSLPAFVQCCPNVTGICFPQNCPECDLSLVVRKDVKRAYKAFSPLDGHKYISHPTEGRIMKQQKTKR